MSSVVSIDPRTDPRWESLARGPQGSLFISPPWISAVCETYGFTPSGRLLLDDRGQSAGGLTWVDVADIRGQRRLALPFCDRADPVVSDLASWQAVSADALAGDLPFTVRALEGSPAAQDDRLTTVGEAAWHETSLTRPLDELHGAFRSQTRRNIARAERSGVEVVLSPESDAVAEYHRLHVGLRKNKYRLLAQPQELFDRIWKAFAPTDSIRTALALVDGRPVAGAVYLVWDDRLYYKFGASQAEYLGLRPNDALHWSAIQWAHDRGLAALDWGLSDLDQPGLVGYKRNWASVEGRIRTLNAGGRARGAAPGVDGLLGALTDLLTDPSTPDALTERAGALLYQYFC